MMQARGQTLVELLLAIGIAAVVLPALFLGLMSARSGRAQQKQRLEATALLKETKEAVRNVREKGWATFAVNGTFHTEISGSSWTLATGSATVNGFTKQVVISDVYRDSTGAITPSTAETLDPSTKKVVTTISWLTPYPSNFVATEYITRYLDNLSYPQSTVADFTPGTKTNTAITNTVDGEIILGAGGGGGDWCQPSFLITNTDLPKSGVSNAITAIKGPNDYQSTIFAGTGDNASGVSFAKVDASSGSATLAKTFDGYKTNAVFGESSFAYLATDNNAKEVVIMSLTQYADPPTNQKYKEVGAIDLPGNGNADSIYVANDKAYVLGGTKLYIYSLNAGRTTATLQNTGGLDIAATGKKIIVGAGGQYAYVMTGASTNQFRIINITNAASPSTTSTRTIGSAQTGVDIFINTSETLAYAAIAYSAGKNNVYSINITNKASPSVVTTPSYSTNGMNPKGITVVTGNRAIVVGTGGTYQYQVISTTSMALCAANSQLQYASGINGVAAVLQDNGYAYAYIITGDAASELKVILGGAGGQYSSAGTFTSAPFDVATQGLTQTAFNRFDAEFSRPPQTTIGFQVAVANAVSNSCTNANYTFVGPNRTSSPTDLFTDDGTVPLMTSGNYTNPGRCFKYKVYLTSSDPTQTPELYDFTVNYSP